MNRKTIAVVFLCSLVSISCFAAFGYSHYGGTDYQYHLSSWLDYTAAWKSGVAYPAWSAAANLGLGEPRFYFYPPISFWFGSVLSLLLPLKLVPAVFVWLSFCLAGFSMYLLSGLFLPPRGRLQVSALYCVSYYLLITASKRFALAELLANAFLPVVCYFFVKILVKQRRSACIGLAIAMALAWQTDVPAAMNFAYTLFIASCIYCLQTRRVRPFLLHIGAQVLSLALSGWYFVPAYMATKYMSSTSSLPYDFRPLFVRTATAFLDETLSAFAVIAAALLIFCLASLRKSEEDTDGVRLLIYLGLVAFFFQLPFTRLLWEHLPGLRIVGFPFRFQTFFYVALPIAVFSLKQARTLRTFVFVLSGTFAAFPFCTCLYWAHAHGSFKPMSEYVRSLDGGSMGMTEYVPKGTGAVVVRTPDQQPRVGQVSSSDPGCSADVKSWLPEDREIDTTAQTPCTYQLRLYYFPFWHLTIDGKPLAASFGKTGLLNFSVPAGAHHVSARFVRPVEPQLLGEAISFVTLLFLATLYRHEKHNNRKMTPVMALSN
ncbi:hypothetical protein H7849_20740 [Alloacidobacterium dinghuense]|uniref:Membrane protein 6-pyruvoyl-tetrahydropterin synthase-related domain-containing protein n=1 Tax=Alloacidobacterium dinghuense TaxID=2763107 RepID=A0A7G8BG08_9BACT|nr:hypothetical protein [Alloacidobacterium dinghuense]QNI31478.1 hypothetical protein H7849_20740 [Alloacidobacterium dinghuense]